MDLIRTMSTGTDSSCCCLSNAAMLICFRSSPIITTSAVVKNKGQFIFESEKPNSHNALLKEINKGVRLKKTKTNDRSKPNLEGLRKFRRQMTIEEQVQKSMSQANLAASPSGVGLAAGAEASSSHVCIVLHTL